eukprot:4707569-Ditylum_brightwellii.AAC.1
MASIGPEDNPNTPGVNESLPLDGFPKAGYQPGTYRHWMLLGSTFDPWGYWGPAGNYILATPTPFFLHDLSINAVAVPPGTLEEHTNGISTPDRFIGINAIRPFTSSEWYHGSTNVSMTMDRLDYDGNVVDSLFIGDDCSSSILHSRC